MAKFDGRWVPLACGIQHCQSLQYGIVWAVKSVAPPNAFRGWAALSAIMWLRRANCTRRGASSAAPVATSSGRRGISVPLLSPVLAFSSRVVVQQAVLLGRDLVHLWQSGAVQRWWKNQRYGTVTGHTPTQRECSKWVEGLVQGGDSRFAMHVHGTLVDECLQALHSP